MNSFKSGDKWRTELLSSDIPVKKTCDCLSTASNRFDWTQGHKRTEEMIWSKNLITEVAHWELPSSLHVIVSHSLWSLFQLHFLLTDIFLSSRNQNCSHIGQVQKHCFVLKRKNKQLHDVASLLRNLKSWHFWFTGLSFRSSLDLSWPQLLSSV